MIQKYELGGQKMPDLKSKILSQKMKWIQNYLNNKDCLWRYTFETLTNQQTLSIFLRGTFTTNDIVHNSRFYKETLSALFTVTERNRHLRLYSRNQFIYYNNTIRINNKMLYDHDLFTAGIWYEDDLYHNNETIPFKTWQKRGVPIQSFLTWFSLISIISKRRKQEMQKIDYPFLDILFIDKKGNKHNILTLTSKRLTELLTVNKLEKTKAQLELTKRYNLSEDTLEEIYLVPQTSIKNNQIKEFQYKILNKYLPTNSLLYKMKKTTSFNCNFCNNNKETISHMFVDCFNVKNF